MALVNVMDGDVGLKIALKVRAEETLRLGRWRRHPSRFGVEADEAMLRMSADYEIPDGYQGVYRLMQLPHVKRRRRNVAKAQRRAWRASGRQAGFA